MKRDWLVLLIAVAFLIVGAVVIGLKVRDNADRITTIERTIATIEQQCVPRESK